MRSAPLFAFDPATALRRLPSIDLQDLLSQIHLRIYFILEVCAALAIARVKEP